MKGKREIEADIRQDATEFDPGLAEGLPSADDAELTVAWYDASLDAGTWLALRDVRPDEAALLLCGFNPHEGASVDDALADARNLSTSSTTPQDFKAILRAFEDARSSNHESTRTLREWFAIAERMALRHHQWLNEYIEACDRLRSDNHAALALSTSPGDPSRDSTEGNGAPDASLVHRLRSRTNPLAAVLRRAIKEAEDPDDWASGWAALVRLAESEGRPAPLIGFVEGEVKYSNGDQPCFLTEEAFRSRFRRLREKQRPSGDGH